jgi:hypothetical protein
MKGITEWIKGWTKNNWKTASKKPVKNAELWKELLEETKRHHIDWKWVKGHSGHPDNERVDDLANIAIDEMLEALDKICPGVYSRHTLLYGVEVKFYSSRLEVKDNLETKVDDLYVAGDGAGITRGLMQASSSGVVIARDILAD